LEVRETSGEIKYESSGNDNSSPPYIKTLFASLEEKRGEVFEKQMEKNREL